MTPFAALPNLFFIIWSMQVKTLKLILMMILSKQIILINSVKNKNFFVFVISFLTNLSLSSASSQAHFFFILTLPAALIPSSFPSLYLQRALIPNCLLILRFRIILLSLLRVCHLPLSVPPASPFLLLLLLLLLDWAAHSPVRSKHHVHLCSFLTCEQREPLTWLTFNVACMAANAFTSFILLQFCYT